jgi:hypothetical protein
MNTGRGDMEADLDVLRDLLRRYGLQTVNSMVNVAMASRTDPSSPFSSPRLLLSAASQTLTRQSAVRESVVSSSGRSIMSSVTSASQTTGTSSALSFYTDSASIRSVTKPQWPAAALPPSGTSTPGDLFDGSPITTAFPADSPSGADSAKTKLACPFCAEFHIDQRIGRKPDLKRHFIKIHSLNAQWICKLQGGCNLSFDFAAAFDAHVKDAHGGIKDPDARVNTCAQVVFACGFERCREVFEAPTDAQADATMHAYFDHVLAHLAAPSVSVGRWTYSRRIRNLLHQEAVRAAWKDCSDGHRGHELVWEPQRSSVLRKMLECRHLGADMGMLCRYAVLLGSGRHAPAVAPSNFAAPVLNTCTLVSDCHDPRRDERFAKGPRLPKRPARKQQPGAPAVLGSSPSLSAFSGFNDIDGPDLYLPDPVPSNGLTSAAGFAPTFAVDVGGVGGDFHHAHTHAHPLELQYPSYVEALGPPAQHEVVMDAEPTFAAAKRSAPAKRMLFARRSVERMRARRNSSPERMAESPPPMPQVFVPQMPVQQPGHVRRRSSGAMDAEFYGPAMVS